MYTFRVDVSLTATVEVEAESYDEATQLATEWHMVRNGFFHCFQAKVVDSIESDDDPSEVE